jgi:hypothetical protein
MTLFEHSFASDLSERLGPGFAITLTDNRSTMVSIRKKNGITNVRIARYLALGDRDVTDGLFAYLVGSVKSLPKNVRAFAESQPAPKDAARRVKVKAQPKGFCYDLGKIARNINQQYFDGVLKVTITWGRGGVSPKRKRSKNRHVQLGSYSRDIDLIRINPVLDTQDVPLEYIGLVIYHEMLHKKFDAEQDGKKTGGRRSVHPMAFRKAEKEYEGFEAAMAWEAKNLDRLFAMREKANAAKSL